MTYDRRFIASATLHSQIAKVNNQRHKDVAKILKDFLQDVLKILVKQLKKEGVEDASAKTVGGRGHLSAGDQVINFDLAEKYDQVILTTDGGGYSPTRIGDKIYPEGDTAQEVADELTHRLMGDVFWDGYLEDEDE